MQNKNSVRRFGLFALALVALFGVPLEAHAQTTTPTVDYAALATSAKDGVVTALGAGAPVAFVLLAAMLGIGVVWRLLKRGAKSV